MSARKRRRISLLLLFFLLAALVVANQRVIWRPFYPIRYRDELVRESRRNGLDPYLVAAIVRTESGWREGVVSARGAIGLMQIMPDTGSWAAGQIGIKGFTDQALYDPEVNLRIGCWYVAELLREFGSEVAMLAAYNAGRGNVNQWLQSGRWTGQAETVADIPFRETRDFIARVLAARSRFIWIYGSSYLAE